MASFDEPMATLLDSHCHCFNAAHLEKSSVGEHPPPYPLRNHLDGLLALRQGNEEIVVVNVAMSAFPTSRHVIDSFDELSRLQTLYGARYAAVRCVLGTVRADEPNAAQLLANPLVIGARLFLRDLSPAAAVQAVALAPIEALRTHDKYLEIWATELKTLRAAVEAVPDTVRLMIDHLGAWAAPPLAEYEELLALLATRTKSVVLKGPGHRTSEYVPVTARYVALAIRHLGAQCVLLSATDAPHVLSSTELFRGQFASGPLSMVSRLELLLGRSDDGTSMRHGAAGAVLRYAPAQPPSPAGMIHASRPDWYDGDDVFIDVGPAKMHMVLMRPRGPRTCAEQPPAAKRAKGTGSQHLVCIAGSGYTGFLALYPALAGQVLTRHGLACIAIEYPGYGASTGRDESEVSIRNQSDCWRAAADYAREALGFTTVVGVAWAMGSAALVQACLPMSSPGGFSGVCLLNALLDARLVHTHVIDSVNRSRRALERKIADGNLERDVELPPPTYEMFAKMVLAMEDDALYPGFAGYPLDARTLDVVIDQLYAHEGYAVPRVRGRFWKELLHLSHGSSKLSCPVLLIHGTENELHTPENVRQFAAANGTPVQLLAGVRHNDFMQYGHPSHEEMMQSIAAFAERQAAKLPSGEPTLTRGKASFHDLYDHPDAAPYMRTMKEIAYEIGDHTGRIARKAFHSLGREGADDFVILELCAGYGLSMVPIRTTYASAEFIEHFLAERPPLEKAIEADIAFLAKAARTTELSPPPFVVGVDVASNALTYGMSVGLFDAVIARNLEQPGARLTAAEAALISRTKLVIATGALSYITSATLEVLFSCWSASSPPAFLLFPLVATDVDAVLGLLRGKGMQVYYDRRKHWLPQRRFRNAEEQQSLDKEQRQALGQGESPPPSAREGWVHAVPILAVPASMDLQAMAAEWLGHV